MDYKSACHRLRITPTLLSWFTRFAPKKGETRKLQEQAGGEFDVAELDAFDAYLRTDWAAKYVPQGINRELLVEACGKCPLCDDPCEKFQMAHVRRRKVEAQHYYQHPANLIPLCGTCHDRYDDPNLKSISFDVVLAAKERLVSRKMEAIDRDVERARAIRDAVETTKSELTTKFSGLLGGAPANKLLWTAGSGELLAAAIEATFGGPRVVPGMTLVSAPTDLTALSGSIGVDGEVSRAVLDGYAKEASGVAAVAPSQWDMLSFVDGSPCQMSGQACPSCRTGTMNTEESGSGVECSECGLFVAAGS